MNAVKPLNTFFYQTECSPENILRPNSEEEVYTITCSEEMLTRLLSFAS